MQHRLWRETRRAGIVAAWMEGKLLAMMILTVLQTLPLTVSLRSQWAPAQFIATKQGEEAQTGPAEYLAASAIMLKGQHSFEAQCSLSCLTLLTGASAHQADQSMPLCLTKVNQTSWHQITFGASGPKQIYPSSCAFSKSAEDVQVIGRFFAKFRI